MLQFTGLQLDCVQLITTFRAQLGFCFASFLQVWQTNFPSGQQQDHKEKMEYS